MTLQVRAWTLREQALRALSEGDPPEALRLARQAQRLYRTPAGTSLLARAATAPDSSGKA